jgi:hypothetical protein
MTYLVKEGNIFKKFDEKSQTYKYYEIIKIKNGVCILFHNLHEGHMHNLLISDMNIKETYTTIEPHKKEKSHNEFKHILLERQNNTYKFKGYLSLENFLFPEWRDYRYEKLKNISYEDTPFEEMFITNIVSRKVSHTHFNIYTKKNKTRML